MSVNITRICLRNDMFTSNNDICAYVPLSISRKDMRRRNFYHNKDVFIWAASSEIVPSSMRNMRRFRSSCACAKYHPGLCSPFIHYTVFVSGQ